jgi:hypothetical protein
VMYILLSVGQMWLVLFSTRYLLKKYGLQNKFLNLKITDVFK